jgi:hypothetical protein
MSEPSAAFRARELAAIPRWYSPLLHFGGTVTVGLIAVILTVSMIGTFSWAEMLIVVPVVLIANVIEWSIHRDALHHPKQGFLRDIYHQHTMRHHRIFRTESMALHEWREIKFVMLSVKTIGLIALLAAPIALLPGWLFGADVGWIAMATEVLYVVSYELVHLSHHLPDGHWFRRLGWLDGLRWHHAIHHDPRVMRKSNFCVTFPFADWLFKTKETR